MFDIKIIRHTADKGIRIQADSLEELFRGALQGMARIQREDPKTEQSLDEIHKKLRLQAPDCTALLVDFLSETHTLGDIHKAIFSEVHFHQLTGQKLNATINGNQVKSFDEDIKAVTHSQADITKNAGGLLETIIVFDI